MNDLSCKDSKKLDVFQGAYHAKSGKQTGKGLKVHVGLISLVGRNYKAGYGGKHRSDNKYGVGSYKSYTIFHKKPPYANYHRNNTTFFTICQQLFYFNLYIQLTFGKQNVKIS